MAIPKPFVEELLQRADVAENVGSYVSLQRKGGNWWGLCPFHGEKTPSFSVSDEKQIYYCFGCHKGGSVLNFLMEMEHVSYPEAIRLLAGKVGMPVPEEGEADRQWRQRRERIFKANKLAAHYYVRMLTDPRGQAVVEYMKKRRISPAMATAFGLGAAPDS